MLLLKRLEELTLDYKIMIMAKRQKQQQDPEHPTNKQLIEEYEALFNVGGEDDVVVNLDWIEEHSIFTNDSESAIEFIPVPSLGETTLINPL